jgi:pimeloyl-ACP methyl ester carboxylesterase
MIKHMSKRTVVNGVNLHYVVAGEGPVVLGMRGWPQNQREFLPLIEKLAAQYRFIVPDLRGLADSKKPFSGYEPKTIAALATTKHVCELMGLSDHRHRPARPEAVSRRSDRRYRNPR